MRQNVVFEDLSDSQSDSPPCYSRRGVSQTVAFIFTHSQAFALHIEPLWCTVVKTEKEKPVSWPRVILVLYRSSSLHLN